LPKTHQQHAEMLSSGGVVQRGLDQAAGIIRNQIRYHCCGLSVRGVVSSLRITDSASMLHEHLALSSLTHMEPLYSVIESHSVHRF